MKTNDSAHIAALPLPRHHAGLCPPKSGDTMLGQGWDEVLEGHVKMNKPVSHNVA
jgi:hypothetical protein